MRADVILGDCLDVMRTMPAASVDAVVTDPPYGLKFMGKLWDHGVPGEQFWAEALRVAKPGAALLAFGGTRTFHRLACAIEDAGWELRDSLGWNHMEPIFCRCDAFDGAERRLPDGASTRHGGPVRIPLEADGGRPSRGPRPGEQRADEPAPLAVEWIPQGGGAWPGCPRCGKPLAPPLFQGPLAWNYGSGFPKSLDVSKAIDKAAGAERKTIGPRASYRPNSGAIRDPEGFQDRSDGMITAPASDDARKWSGWGTALKPAWEPVILARKPLRGTVAANVLAHGTGALNVDACRVGWAGIEDVAAAAAAAVGFAESRARGTTRQSQSIGRESRDGVNSYDPDKLPGRWPANVLLDEASAAMVDEMSGESRSPATVGRGGVMFGGTERSRPGETVPCFGDSGGASRFFYTAKASRWDREDGLEGVASRSREARYGSVQDARPHTPDGYEYHRDPRHNHHPTVKPTDLMRWLCRLVTPPGGTVLDPFCGSGSTGVAALSEGFNFVGIEREAEYVEIARRRIANVAPLFAEGGAA